MSNIVFLNGVRLHGCHRVLAVENDIGQIFVVDTTLEIDLSYVGRSDDVENTVNCGEVHKGVKSTIERPCSRLIERLAERIVKHINSHYNHIMEIKVRIIKEDLPIPSHYDGVGVEIVREND